MYRNCSLLSKSCNGRSVALTGKISEESDELLERVITGDESWIYDDDIELKSQSREWKNKESTRLKKSRKSKSKIKVMLLFFFDCHGIVHHEFAPEGQTVNAAFYVEVSKRLRDHVRLELWEGRRWILHHNNAPAHSALLACEFLARNSITVLEHPPYSPDLAPCNFFLVLLMQIGAAGAEFG